MNKLTNIGIAGLAVMGENLVLNMASKGFSVSVYNRTSSKVDNFLTGRGKGKRIVGFATVEDFVKSIERPRKVMMMLKAGSVIDNFIEQLLPYLEEGDIIIDGGNSHYPDTIRRTANIEEKGLLYIGTGVSGGEEGALKGPSIMPGGSFAAWKYLEPIFVPISAKIADGSHCCSWMGSGGAGHFVKMVHNGIEYGDMQLICETYQIMKDVLNLQPAEIHTIFKKWNDGVLGSYLIEITRDIMAYQEDDGSFLIDKILDTAGQKGTGKWTVSAALDNGTPLSLISESVFARCLSAQKDERLNASTVLMGPEVTFRGNKTNLIGDLERALYMAKIISYTQGFNLMRRASEEFGWNLNYGEIARIWRGGCIIRSAFLDEISSAYGRQPDLQNLMLDPFFSEKIQQAQNGLRNVLCTAIGHGISIPCLCSALNYYDGFRSARLPANLLQAQRDYFGAHTYELLDRPRGEFFHTNWTGEGGNTTSTSYNK